MLACDAPLAPCGRVVDAIALPLYGSQCKVIPLDSGSGTSSSSTGSSGGALSGGLSSAPPGTKSSFQFASLDDRGLVNFWVAVEIQGADLYVRAGYTTVALTAWCLPDVVGCCLVCVHSVSEVDYGLGIGSSLKLIKTASCHVYRDQAQLDALLRQHGETMLSVDPGNVGPSVNGIHFAPNDTNKYSFPAVSAVPC